MARFDLVTMGRSSIDLYSQDVGVAFEQISGFSAYVGGSPTNISVGAKRLGLDTALISAVGTDKVGDFVLAFLKREGVNTAGVVRMAEKRTSAVLLGIEPPDRFPLVFYREGCADIAMGIDEVDRAALEDTTMFLVTGTGLSQEPSRSATMWALETARAAGATTVLDVDLRADQWHDPRAFGVVLRSVLPLIDVVIGTEEELKATGGVDNIEIPAGQVSSPVVHGDLDGSVQHVLGAGPTALVLKRGIAGATIYQPDADPVDAAPFVVDVMNVLGAGDGFASGLLYGRLQGWDWQRSARFGNAVGAILVTKPGCADFMPTTEEVMAFASSQGGL